MIDKWFPTRQYRCRTLRLLQVDEINYIIYVNAHNAWKTGYIYFTLIDTCARKRLFINSLSCLFEVVYYLKQVFRLLYDKSVSPAEALHHFSLIL